MMKKIFLLSLLLVFVFASTTLYAAEKYSLGMGNIALKVDYINFTEDLDKVDLEIDEGVYVGLEGYYAIYPNLYLGLEAGWAGPENDGDVEIDGENVNVDIEVTYIPVELNLKYAFELAPSLVMDLGAGVSYNYFKIELNRVDVDEDDWVLGGQVFADLNYKLSNQWFIGINGKYQFTDDLEIEVRDQDIKQDISADNWRVGAQVGLMF